MTPEQYDKNVSTKKGASERVEFAIKLPGRNSGENVVWLPIDAKFPLEDYQKLLDAREQTGREEAEESPAAPGDQDKIRSEKYQGEVH